MGSMKWREALHFAYLASFLLLVAPATDPGDTAALKAFLDKIQDPFGRLQNWQGDNPCDDEWEGVICGDPIGDTRRVVQLRLLNSNLTGQLAPELGDLTNLRILDVMWNQITGSIPKELGKLKQLQLLLLNGNKLTGSIPDELGNLTTMDRIQIDLNNISGPVPTSFKYLTNVKHLHMNNNSLSGTIPPELGSLPSLLHLLLDNNNLSGVLPSELANASNLQIIQLDNNKFTNASIPTEYGLIFNLTKLSLRNCDLNGLIPDLKELRNLQYLDLSHNKLAGGISTLLSQNITTIDLSSNTLNGTIPESFGNLQNLQTLLLRNNRLTGSIPQSLGTGSSFTSWTGPVVMDFQNNSLSLGSNNLTSAVSDRVKAWFHGNEAICNSSDLAIENLCKDYTDDFFPKDNVQDDNIKAKCDDALTCVPGYEVIPSVLVEEDFCMCAMPITVGYRLKSPGFSFFSGYVKGYEQWIAEGIKVSEDQVYVDSFLKEPGPRFATILKVFPGDGDRMFNESEAMRIYGVFSDWNLPSNDLFGPQELLFYNYSGVPITSEKKQLSWGAISAILVACIVVTAIVVSLIMLRWMRRRRRIVTTAEQRKLLSRKKASGLRLFKVAGVKAFTLQELAVATLSFSDSMRVGKGGYGNVYRGILSDGQVVAIKCAKEGSLQGAKEFYTEIELLSRVHHRNLVSLVGYCTDEDDQMLVYEYMENGTLGDHLSSSSSKHPLDFCRRLRIALGAARGILYLHTEANPPIFHRDIKASNILLDEKLNAKVSDFGLSRLAPNPEVEGSGPGHVSTVVKGTPGYLDPEYFRTHILTDKSDVYSFGVVLLELVTGMQPIAHGKNIVREVNYAYDNGMMLHIVDPRMGAFPAEGLEPFVRLALSCCKADPVARPSMADVVRDLEDIWRLVPWSDLSDVVEPEVDSKEIKVSKALLAENPCTSFDGDTSEIPDQNTVSIHPR